jgi:hypothetical protein
MPFAIVPAPYRTSCRYELHITTARLLDWYGGPHDITAADYFAAELAERHGGYRQTA